MSLTGGTRDVNPQWLKFTASANTTTSFATTTIDLPNSVLASPSRPTIMEILAVKWIPVGNLNIEAGTTSTFRGYITTKSFGTTEPDTTDGTIVDMLRVGSSSIAASTSSIIGETVYYHDVTDQQGHGVLVATDKMYLGVVQTDANTPFDQAKMACHVLYRFKRVALTEYIGIVQSQQ